ncbi:MAG TPA: YgiQ family radical SAM protein [Methanothrix sp.]|nr:YgiQ family radical SAM protein [Methanothrix sp.]
MNEQPHFLPMSMQEARELKIDQFDVILISGDAYVDHPSFAAAIIGRVLWDAGYSVGIIAQPDWRKDEDFKRLGRPRLFFGISSGNVDSMVNNLTANLKRRSSDVYSPGGALLRPDRAAIVYTDRIHALFPGVPIILGGIEASLRRFAHYDYWSDSVRRSILADAPADLIIYGMGEAPLREVALRLEKGERIGEIGDVAGTTVKQEIARWRRSPREGSLVIPSFAEVSTDRREYARAFAMHYGEQDPFHGDAVVQVHPKTVIIQNPPARPLRTEELDRIYELPFTREAHPSYREAVPALEPVRFSITSHRGCFGSCSFCALTHHQGRIVQSRSEESILREAAALTRMKGFAGVISDVGGPTANMYGLFCHRWKTGACSDKLCSADCPSLNKDHTRQVELLRRLRKIPGVKRVFIGSGIRHDLIMADQSSYLEELCRHHVSGHLKIAPEHISPAVTECMHKPSREVLDAFRERFAAASRAVGKEQYLLPYLMSGHPGCTVKEMVELAEYLRDNRMYTEQVQDFTPTPMTVSTAMYHTGLDPFTLKPVHVPKGREKRIQRAILQYRDPRNYDLVREGLQMAGRTDLIGQGRRCLIPARPAGGWGMERRKGEKREGKRQN